MSNMRTKTILINDWTDRISNRQKNVALTASAVGKIFSGYPIPNTNWDFCITPGIFRVTDNIDGTKPPIMSVAGFLQVMDVNREEEDSTSTLKNAVRVRQILYPDAIKLTAPEDVNEDGTKKTTLAASSPYTRLGYAASTSGTIEWTQWSVLGGGTLDRVVLSVPTDRDPLVDVQAQPNVLYEAFGNYTIILPNPNEVPVATQIGVEQHTGNSTIKTADETCQLMTEPEITVSTPAEVTGPELVRCWTLYDIEGTYNVPSKFAVKCGMTYTSSSIVVTDDNGQVNGTYDLYTSGTGQDRVWKHTQKSIYLWYEKTAQEWKFTSAPNSKELIYAVAEITFKTSESIIYLFQCAMAEDGTTKEWILDADPNYSKAIAILSGRINTDAGKLDFIENTLVPSRGRRTYVFNTLPNITLRGASNVRVNIDDHENLDLYDLEYCLSANPASPITLPAARTTPETGFTINNTIGAKVSFRIYSAVASTQTITYGSYSQVFQVQARTETQIEFEWTYFNGALTWVLLSAAPSATV